MPTPNCSITPIIIPLNGCLEVTVGVMKSVSIFVINRCNPFLSNVSDIVVSAGITGMKVIQRHHQPVAPHPPQHPRAPQQLQQQLLLKHQHRLRLLQLRRHPPQLLHQQLQLRQQRRQHQARQLPPQQQQRQQSLRQFQFQRAYQNSMGFEGSVAGNNGPAARRRRRRQQKENRGKHDLSTVEHSGRRTPNLNKEIRITRPNTNEHAYDLMDLNKSRDSFLSLNDSQGTRLTSASNLQNTPGVNVTRVSDAEKPFRIGNATIQPPNREQESDSASVNHRSGVQVRRVSRVSKLDESNELQPIDNEPIKAASMASRKASGITIIKFPQNKNVRAVSVDANSNKLDGQRRYDGVFSTATNKTNQIMIKSSKPITVNVLDSSLNGRPRATSLGRISVVKITKSVITDTVDINLLKKQNLPST
ncbi:unnamed protein product [Adineta steineri]|uniref:Uncharacterized protein n=1 Tax=Adineta steineri TaxID=433720 RepID=A0A818XG07_9BILA|nr:unnamed protein product [Adineta steineri]